MADAAMGPDSRGSRHSRRRPLPDPDRDGTFVPSFDAVFRDKGARWCGRRTGHQRRTRSRSAGSGRYARSARISCSSPARRTCGECWRNTWRTTMRHSRIRAWASGHRCRATPRTRGASSPTGCARRAPARVRPRGGIAPYSALERLLNGTGIGSSRSWRRRTCVQRISTATRRWARWSRSTGAGRRSASGPASRRWVAPGPSSA